MNKSKGAAIPKTKAKASSGSAASSGADVAKPAIEDDAPLISLVPAKASPPQGKGHIPRTPERSIT